MKRSWPSPTYCSNPNCPLPDGIIPPETLQNRHRSRWQMEHGPNYCSKQCSIAHKRATGLLKRASQQGNAVQAEYKAKHGKAPGVRGGARLGGGNKPGWNKKKVNISSAEVQ